MIIIQKIEARIKIQARQESKNTKIKIIHKNTYNYYQII
jgi:hypothetical protein